MTPVVGVFGSRSNAEHGAHELRSIGIADKNINILTPDSSERDVAKVPHVEGEQPGIVKAIGAVAGGATGLGMGEAVATLLVPGVGPVLAMGLAGGALLGALAGGAIGAAAENALFSGLPSDELFVYEDALRKGRTVLVAMAVDKKQAEAARSALDLAGAESIDRAREMWWVGLRDVEKERYEADGGDFQRDEAAFRIGFSAALERENREESYAAASDRLRERYPELWNSASFKRGYERGFKYWQETNRER